MDFNFVFKSGIGIAKFLSHITPGIKNINNT